MRKPTPITDPTYDYHECEKYIAQKLGIKDLRDIEGKWDPDNDGKREQLEYKDFWHFLVNSYDVSNGSVFQLWSDCPKAKEDWQQEILDAFVEEFGKGARYEAWW